MLRLNRPEKRNCLSQELIGAMRSALEECTADPGIRVVIIIGAGNAFCAGADLAELEGLTSSVDLLEWANSIQSLFHFIETMPKQVIAAVNGLALGGGCELAISCDLRIASSTVFFGLPEINVGLLPGGGGMSRLSRIIGIGRAKEMVYSGRQVPAEEALAMGLVNRVVEPAALEGAAGQLALELAEKPPVGLRMAKATMQGALETDIRTASQLEAGAVGLLFQTADRQEGIRAFLEKRRPSFTGR